MQQIREAPRRHLQAEAGLQQVGDLGQRQAAAGVQLNDQRDHTGAELCVGRPQRVGGLQGVAALDPPPTLRAVADLDVEAAHQRGAPGEGLPDIVPPRRSLRPRRRSPDTSSAPVPPGPRRRAPGSGGVPAGHSAHRAAGRDGPPRPCGRFLAKGAACRRPAAAFRPQLLFQVLVLALQALVLTLQAVVPALQAAILPVHALVARQIVTQSPELPVLLLDDNVPRILLGRSFVQNGAYAA